ncbi:MAG: hypothetical protein IJY74_00995 [Oscillospiraceae bacterium]|nr:hypothetical protein [Oscillospiraceae bacterium]
MKNKKIIYIIGFLWTAVLGTLLHFTYEWSGQNSFVGLFSAVNESIWEHMKLLFFPAASYALITYPFMRKSSPPYLTACAFAILTGMAVQTSAYYIYSGIIGKDIPWVNIVLFYACAALISILSYKWSKRKWNTGSLWGFAIICAVSVCFFFFTANSPDVGVFSDPESFSLTQFSFDSI